MPISHALQTIFVHIPKTAGTSVEAVLGMHGTRQDIGIRPYFNQTADSKHLYGGNLQHMTAARLRTALGQDALFERYFKFSIVRNPWERLVSTCAWSDQKWAHGVELGRAEFDSRVRQLHGAFCAARTAATPLLLPAHFEPQRSYVLNGDGRPMVDFIARYETLAADWDHIRARLGVSATLPVRMRSHHRPYREYYDDETRAMVAEIYAEDASAFGYVF